LGYPIDVIRFRGILEHFGLAAGSGSGSEGSESYRNSYSLKMLSLPMGIKREVGKYSWMQFGRLANLDWNLNSAN
jgi:hypothetical protein